MQIVIPMSGFGERFRAKGYDVPKPLIEVDGKPIIRHVTEMYPKATSFVFICNEDHLADEQIGMVDTLEAIEVPKVIVGIPSHKLGPVHAVLEASQYVTENEPVIVSYADFSCVWDFNDFSDYVSSLDVDCAVPAYKGFHPHNGGKTNYAYVRENQGNILQVSEKTPLTNDKTQEYASTGAYYFKSGSIMLQYFRTLVDKDIRVGGEFYVSSAVDLLAKDGLRGVVYEIDHFMQWGTPEDLAEYLYWSGLYFTLHDKGQDLIPIASAETRLILASGAGSRFTRAGYTIEKPLLPVSGDAMMSQIAKVTGPSEDPRLLCLKGSQTDKFLENNYLGPVTRIDSLTDGQATSASILVSGLEDGSQGAFTILPCDTLFGDSTRRLHEILAAAPEECIIVWATKPSPRSLEVPEEYGWVWTDENVTRVSVKEKPLGRNALLMSGAFTFSSPELFEALYSKLRILQLRVNSEFFVDSLVKLAASEGVKVMIFEPEFCMPLGSPLEFETAKYWQTAFSRWEGHPYNLSSDPFYDGERLRSESSSGDKRRTPLGAQRGF